jgi:hypothetical protein
MFVGLDIYWNGEIIRGSEIAGDPGAPGCEEGHVAQSRRVPGPRPRRGLDARHRECFKDCR